MKKSIVLLAIIMLSGMLLNAQSSKNKIEVLYFKANLACCKAKACNVLENDIKAMVYKIYPDSNVVFKEILLADTMNNSLIAKYKAQSQTVVIIKKKKNKEISIDISGIVKTYVQNQNKETLEQEMKSKFDELEKKKA